VLQIVITASASLGDKPEVVWVAFMNAVAAFHDRLEERPPYRFVHGDATLVERQLAERLREAGREVATCPADWKSHGREAGWRRNEWMVERADALIAVWDGYSASTLHAASLAAVRGIPWECRIIGQQKGWFGAQDIHPRHLAPWEEEEVEQLGELVG